MGDGELAALRRDTLGFVFQQFNLIPTLTAVQNVEAALAPRRCKARRAPAARGRAARRVGLGERAVTCPPSSRAASSSAWRSRARSPTGRGCCWPTSRPATSTRRRATDIIDLLRRLCEDEGLTIVLVTHDPSIAEAAQRVVRMRDGRVLEAEEAVGVRSIS